MYWDRRTVRHWLNAQTFPERAQRAPVPRKIDPYLPYLKRRWNEGCHNAAALYREIAAEGYTGATGMVRLVLQSWRHILPRSPIRFSVPSPRRACAWLLRSKSSPTSKFGYPQRFINRLCRQNPLIGTAQRLAQDFIAMVRKQLPIQLIDMKGLAQDVKDNPDAYPHERARRFGVSPSGIRAALKRLRVTYKKRRSSIRRQTKVPEFVSKPR